MHTFVQSTHIHTCIRHACKTIHIYILSYTHTYTHIHTLVTGMQNSTCTSLRGWCGRNGGVPSRIHTHTHIRRHAKTHTHTQACKTQLAPRWEVDVDGMAAASIHTYKTRINTHTHTHTHTHKGMQNSTCTSLGGRRRRNGGVPSRIHSFGKPPKKTV
jgi:hypothetical protein